MNALNLNLKENRAFFVMSTGRSGTKTLAHLLKSATNARVWHHPQPDLVAEAQSAYWQTCDHQSVFLENRAELIEKTWQESLIHGETDHYMTPFATTIAELIPESKFIVLVRDPREFVRSGMRRNYYETDNKWDRARLTPKPGSGDFDSFSALSSFEKVCWLWAETYKFIIEARQTIGEERVLVVKFEELVGDVNTARNIFDYLGLDGFNSIKANQLLSQELNSQKNGSFLHPSDWHSRLHNRCWEIFGNIAEDFGYQRLYQKCRSFHTLYNRATRDNSPKKHKQLNIIESGISLEGFPFLGDDRGVKFYGLPHNKQWKKSFETEQSDELKRLSLDEFSINSDINSRYFKDIQHRRFVYRPGDIVVELGAYIGYYTMNVAERIYPLGEIRAIEMMPEVFKVLNKNLSQFSKVAKPMQAGVAVSSGVTTVYTTGGQRNGLREDVILGKRNSVEKLRLTTKTVDQLLSDLPSIDLCILQLNGIELNVLRSIKNSWNKINNFSVAALYDERSQRPIRCEIADYLDEKGYATEIHKNWVYAQKHRNRDARRRALSEHSPIFIVGCGRSGATLLSLMIDSHPDVACGPESNLLLDPLNLDFKTLAFKFDMSESEVKKMADQSCYLPDFLDRFMITYAQRCGKSRWAEKTLRNIRRLEYIFDNFPGAYVVHVIRDGRDVSCSLRTHPKKKFVDEEWISNNISRPIEECVDRWVSDVEAGIKWRGNARYLEIKYEDLVQHTEPTLRRLFKSLSLCWSDKVLQHHFFNGTARDVNKFLQNEEAIQPINKDSLNRWQNDLTTDELNTIEHRAGYLLRKLGY